MKGFTITYCSMTPIRKTSSTAAHAQGHQSVPCGQSGEWKTARIKLEDARFVNRQNAGSDFRFAIFGGQMAIHEVRVIKE